MEVYGSDDYGIKGPTEKSHIITGFSPPGKCTYVYKSA